MCEFARNARSGPACEEKKNAVRLAYQFRPCHLSKLHHIDANRRNSPTLIVPFRFVLSQIHRKNKLQFAWINSNHTKKNSRLQYFGICTFRLALRKPDGVGLQLYARLTIFLFNIHRTPHLHHWDNSHESCATINERKCFQSILCLEIDSPSIK